MSVRQLIINGISVPVWSTFDLSQTYERIQAAWRPRFLDGGAKQRIAYSGKLRTTIAGSGLIPPGISGLNFDNSYVLSCVAPHSIISTIATIDIPAARRTDSGSTPYGRALVGDNWVDTEVSMGGNTATLTTVANATAYQVVYFPEITVFSDPPTEDKPKHGPVYGWSLTAEEV